MKNLRHLLSYKSYLLHMFVVNLNYVKHSNTVSLTTENNIWYCFTIEYE